MEVKKMAEMGQEALRKNRGLNTKEEISNYFKELRKKRVNYKRKAKNETL